MFSLILYKVKTKKPLIGQTLGSRKFVKTPCPWCDFVLNGNVTWVPEIFQKIHYLNVRFKDRLTVIECDIKISGVDNYKIKTVCVKCCVHLDSWVRPLILCNL